MDLNSRELNFNKFKIGNIGFGLAIVLISLLTTISIILLSLESLFYTWGLIIAIPLIWVMYKNPKYWIYSVLLVFPFYTQDSSVGVSVSDVLIGLFYLASLALWFLESFLISKKKLIYDLPDFLLLFFFIVAALTSYYTTELNTLFLEWMKEYSRFFIVLYYFPIRYYFFEKEDSKFILFFFLAMVFCCDLIQIGKYYFYLKSNIIYAYQLSTSERINQILYTTTIPAAIIFIFYLRNNYLKIVFSMIIIATIGALIATLSRTFWILTIFDVFIIFLYLTLKNKVKLILFSLVFSVILVGSAYVMFQSKFTYLTKFLEMRFSSTGNASKDISLKARYVEWDKVEEFIYDFPLGGLGFSHTFQFHSPLTQEILRTTNIHNGYLFLMYRLGIPLTLVYVLLFIYGLSTSFFLSFRFKDTYYKPLSIATFLGYFSMLFSNFTSAQFFYRDSFFVTAFLFFCSSICYIEYKRLLQNNQNF